MTPRPEQQALGVCSDTSMRHLDPDRHELHGTRSDPPLKPRHLRSTQTDPRRSTLEMQLDYSPVWNIYT